MKIPFLNVTEMSAYVNKTMLFPKVLFKIIFKIQLYYLEIILEFPRKELVEEPFLSPFN